MINIFIIFYDLSWRIALPFLQRSSRLCLGWQQRSLHRSVQGPFDIWIQAASGGESLLTNMVMDKLAILLPKDKRLQILITSGTKEGIDTLTKGNKNRHPNDNLNISLSYFPFDAPHLMQRAFNLFAPKLAVIVETELWPGFLLYAKRNNVPVLLINGRMSKRSFQSYKYCRNFFRKYGPEKILAISPADKKRFDQLVGCDKVELMNNIKLDRIKPNCTAENRSIAKLLPDQSPFVILGSIHRGEEKKILSAILQTIAVRPDVVIGLFPKHLERARHWLFLLKEKGITAVKRSETNERQAPGTIIVWDVFGELTEAYALAKAAFVGGSLVNMGGHNFLEPLSFGLRPIIGPYWHSFAWVGKDITASGLIYEVDDEDELVNKLLNIIDANDSKIEVCNQVQKFFKLRKKGTAQVCRLIIDMQQRK